MSETKVPLVTDASKSEVTISNLQAHSRLADGLANLATGLGTSKDKSTSNQWEHSGLNYDHVSLSVRYREDWLSQKVCQIVPQDMTREWRKFHDEDATDADKAFEVDRLFREAYKWARLYGTSFIVLDIDDGRQTDKPVNWNNLKTNCLRSMHVVDRTRIVTLGEIDQKPMSVTFGMPDHYQFVNTTTPIHKDRLIRFEGTELPIYERQRNLWYSDSILIPLVRQIDNFHTTSFAAAQMVQEANTDVIKVEGLANILQSDVGTNAMLQRFTDWKSIKSVFGVSILDSSEEFDQKKIQLSGVKDLIWEYLKVVAASVSIPATRFLSASPDGMNATGESDLVNYIETLQGLHKDIFVPRLKVVDRLLAAHYGIEEDKFKYEWNCIFPESATQKADRQARYSEGIVLVTDAGILSRSSALEELKKYGCVSNDATIGDDPNANKTTGASNAK
jgi:phage-related protein (TIGR01555 family)